MLTVLLRLTFSLKVININIEKSIKPPLLLGPRRFLLSNLLPLVPRKTNRTWLGWNWLWAVCGRFHLTVSGGNVARGRAGDQYYQGVSSNGINHMWRLSNRRAEMKCAFSPVRKWWEWQRSLTAFQVSGLNVHQGFVVLYSQINIMYGCVLLFLYYRRTEFWSQTFSQRFASNYEFLM